MLIAGAGVSVAGRFLDTSLDDVAWLMRVNFWGVVHCCRTFLPHLLAAPAAHVVTVCSSFGLLGCAGKSAYSASKFAVRGFSEALRMELAGTRCGLTVLYPGPVATNLVRDGRRAASPAQQDAEARFLARRAVPAERVARRAVDGIVRNAARVRVSLDYAAIDWLTRLAPGVAQAVVGAATRRLPF